MPLLPPLQPLLVLIECLHVLKTLHLDPAAYLLQRFLYFLCMLGICYHANFESGSTSMWQDEGASKSAVFARVIVPEGDLEVHGLQEPTGFGRVQDPVQGGGQDLMG